MCSKNLWQHFDSPNKRCSEHRCLHELILKNSCYSSSSKPASFLLCLFLHQIVTALILAINANTLNRSLCTFLTLRIRFQLTGDPWGKEQTCTRTTWNLSLSCICFSCSFRESSSLFSASSFCWNLLTRYRIYKEINTRDNTGVNSLSDSWHLSH